MQQLPSIVRPRSRDLFVKFLNNDEKIKSDGSKRKNKFHTKYQWKLLDKGEMISKFEGKQFYI